MLGLADFLRTRERCLGGLRPSSKKPGMSPSAPEERFLGRGLHISGFPFRWELALDLVQAGSLGPLHVSCGCVLFGPDDPRRIFF